MRWKSMMVLLMVMSLVFNIALSAPGTGLPEGDGLPPPDPVCGDGTCDISERYTCPADCCGDGTCAEPGEDTENCPEDCLGPSGPLYDYLCGVCFEIDLGGETSSDIITGETGIPSINLAGICDDICTSGSYCYYGETDCYNEGCYYEFREYSSGGCGCIGDKRYFKVCTDGDTQAEGGWECANPQCDTSCNLDVECDIFDLSQCTAPTSRCNGLIFQTRSPQCDLGICKCTYTSWTDSSCSASESMCNAECGADTDCSDICVGDSRYSQACNQATCTCEQDTKLVQCHASCIDAGDCYTGELCDCNEEFDGCYGSVDGSTWHTGCDLATDAYCRYREYDDAACPNSCDCTNKVCDSFTEETSDQDSNGWTDKCDGLTIYVPNQSMKYLEMFPAEIVDIHTYIYFNPIEGISTCNAWANQEIWTESSGIRLGCFSNPMYRKIWTLSELSPGRHDLDYKWKNSEGDCYNDYGEYAHLDYMGCLEQMTGIGPVVFYEPDTDPYVSGVIIEPAILTEPVGDYTMGSNDFYDDKWGDQLWSGHVGGDEWLCSAYESCYAWYELDTSVLTNSSYDVYCKVWKWQQEPTWIRINYTGTSTGWLHDYCIGYCWWHYTTLDINTLYNVTVEFMNNDTRWGEFEGCRLERDLNYNDALKVAQSGPGVTDFSELEPQFYIEDVRVTSFQFSEESDGFDLSANTLTTIDDPSIEIETFCMIGDEFEMELVLKESPDALSDNYNTDCNTQNEWYSSFENSEQIQPWDHLILFYAPKYNRYQLQIDEMNDFLSDLYIDNRLVTVGDVVSCDAFDESDNPLGGGFDTCCYSEHFTDSCSALPTDLSYRATTVDLGYLSVGYHSMKFKITDVCEGGYAEDIRITNITDNAQETQQYSCYDENPSNNNFQCDIDVPSQTVFCKRPVKAGCLSYANDLDKDGEGEFENALHYLVYYDYNGCPEHCYCELDGEPLGEDYYLNTNTGYCESVCECDLQGEVLSCPGECFLPSGERAGSQS